MPPLRRQNTLPGQGRSSHIKPFDPAKSWIYTSTKFFVLIKRSNRCLFDNSRIRISKCEVGRRDYKLIIARKNERWDGTFASSINNHGLSCSEASRGPCKLLYILHFSSTFWIPPSSYLIYYTLPPPFSLCIFWLRGILPVRGGHARQMTPQSSTI